MGKKSKNKVRANKIAQPEITLVKAESTKYIFYWVFGVLVITAISFSPMLKNGFTNWDDEFYVIQNALLRGPDWQGIFSKPVVSNYHPLTIITLAFNYQISQLDPTSYLVVNYLLHLINTALVFRLIWVLSDKKVWVAFFAALIFGIHPMHVESVAWVSERKDVLYTLFFLLGMLQYWRHLLTGKKIHFWLCFLFFILSIFSKPAAIIFPLVLVLLDYFKGRPVNLKLFFEKAVFFIVAFIVAIITVKIQSKTAIAGLDLYPVWARGFFACYTVMIYLFRFFIPYPLSAFHPYPEPNNLGWPVMISPLFVLVLLIAVWYYRKNKVVVFSFFFFIINLLLVMQIVSIGNTLVAERYTYVPYIGLAFLFCMLIEKSKSGPAKVIAWLVPSIICVAFGYITFQQTNVWKDSESLWTNVIKYFPEAPVPRTNRANNALKLAAEPANKVKKDELISQALEDCTIALRYKPNHAKGYENRQNIYLIQYKDSLALSDANSLLRLEPNNRLGYYTKGVVYMRFNMPDSSLENFNKCLSISPNVDYALNNRGSLLFNNFGRYDEAIADFTKAISINPEGNYYLNRSYCYYKKGDLANARADAMIARSKGMQIRDDYKKLISLE